MILSIKDGRLFLEEYAHAVQWQYLQRLRPDDAVEDEEELLGGDVANETVEHPREHDLQWLHLQLLELTHDLLLCTEQQLLEQHAETLV